MDKRLKEMRELAETEIKKFQENEMSVKWQAEYDIDSESWSVACNTVRKDGWKGGYYLAEYIDESTAHYMAAANPQAILELLAMIDERDKQLEKVRGFIKNDCCDKDWTPDAVCAPEYPCTHCGVKAILENKDGS